MYSGRNCEVAGLSSNTPLAGKPKTIGYRTMNHFDDRQFSEFVRDAIAPVSDHELQRDLWPHMRQKIDDPGIRVRWFDFVLIAFVIILCVSVPESITGLLFNL